MSLFDVIKYPVSFDTTVEEYMKMPVEIRSHYRRIADLYNITRGESVTLLRQCIAAYDENNEDAIKSITGIEYKPEPMSLFDVIRYPLSTPPSKSELSQLPEDLLYHWVSKSDWKHVNFINREDITETISVWYRKYWNVATTTDNLDLMLLRRLIKDYEPI